MRRPFVLLAVAAFAGLNAPALAGTTSTTFAVTASVAASCTLATVSTLAFGTYDPTSGSNRDSTTSVGVTCTLLTPYQVGLNAGTTAGATVAQRKLQGAVPANSLNYNLYTDSGRTSVWGSTSGVDTVSGVGTGLSQSYTVYGRIPGGTPAGIDTYSDTITVTVNY